MVRKLTAKAAPKPAWTGFIKTRKGVVVDEKVPFPPGLKVDKNFKYTKKDEAVVDAERKKFNSSVRKNWLTSVGGHDGHVESLKAAGMTDADIARIKDGNVPAGYQVHHRYSLDDGGTNDHSNFVLVKNDPYHVAITSHQNTHCKGLSAGESATFDWPVPQGIVYPPGKG